MIQVFYSDNLVRIAPITVAIKSVLIKKTIIINTTLKLSIKLPQVLCFQLFIFIPPSRK